MLLKTFLLAPLLGLAVVADYTMSASDPKGPLFNGTAIPIADFQVLVVEARDSQSGDPSLSRTIFSSVSVTRQPFDKYSEALYQGIANPLPQLTISVRKPSKGGKMATFLKYVFQDAQINSIDYLSVGAGDTVQEIIQFAVGSGQVVYNP